jgi:hypothetical protein
MYLHSKDMEDSDYVTTSTLSIDQSMLHHDMYLHSKSMEDLDYEATVTLPNDHALLQLYMVL